MATARKRVPAAWGVVIFLIAVVLVFAVIRVTIDNQNTVTGVIPEEGEFDRRYALNPILAYTHILPGVVYLVLAPFQVSRRFRNRHLDLHRKMGRFLVPTGVAAGVFGIVFGLTLLLRRLRRGQRLGRVRSLVHHRAHPRLPPHPGREHRPSSPLDDPGLRHRARSGDDQALGRVVLAGLDDARLAAEIWLWRRPV